MVSRKEAYLYTMGALFWIFAGQFIIDLNISHEGSFGLGVWLAISSIWLLMSIDDKKYDQ